MWVQKVSAYPVRLLRIWMTGGCGSRGQSANADWAGKWRL